MPPVIGVVAAVAGAVAAGAVGGGIIGSIVGGLVFAGIQIAGNLIFGPKLPAQEYVRGPETTLRGGAEPHQIIFGETRVYGVNVFAETFNQPGGDFNEFLSWVVVFAGHECQEFVRLYAGDDVIEVSDIDGNGFVLTDRFLVGKPGFNPSYLRVKLYLGTPTQAAEPNLIATSDVWTADHRLRGLCYGYFQMFFDRNVFPNGIPNFSAVIKGDNQIFDVRDSSTGYTDNAALCIYRYFTADFGLAVPTSRMGTASFVTAANVSDEDVQLSAASPTPTQKRYTANGAFTLDSGPISVVEALLTACAGIVVDTQGLYKLYAGAYRTPIIELGEDDIQDELEIRPGTPYNERFNRVTGTFVDPDQGYVETDFPAVKNTQYAIDDGQELTRPMDLPFTTDAIRAQRIAKIHLEKSRQGLVVQGKFFFNAFEVVVGEPIMLTSSTYGWSQKVFMPMFRRIGPDHVYLILQEEASGVYDWAFGEETSYDLAPNTNLPDFTNPQPPASITINSGTAALDIGADGSVTTRILVQWGAAPDVLVDGYEISWFKSSQSGEVFETRIVGRDTREFYIGPVQEGDEYTIAVRSRVISQYFSDWLEASPHTVIGKAEKPSAPETFTLEELASGTRRFAWTHASPDADVRSGGGYRIKYFVGTTSDWNAMTLLHDPGVLKSSPYETTQLAAGGYTFGIKSVDSTGNESDATVFISATLSDPPLRNVLVSRLETVEGWPGTKADCFVSDDGTLRADPLATWSSLASTSWSSLASTPWRELGGTAAPIVYRSPVIDLTVDTSFQPLITVTGAGTQTITARWSLNAEGSPETGSPTKTFEALPVGEVAARYFQYEVTLASVGSPTVLLYFAEIQLILDAEGKVDRYQDIDISSFAAPYFNKIGTGHFEMATKSQQMSAITQAAVVAFQSTGGGVWTSEVVSKTATVGGQTAAEIKLYNNGVAADATIDLELRGPKI